LLLGRLNKIKKYYGERLILDIDKLEILDGDRIGLVGENGAGKSTLLKVLIGEERIDEGSVYLTHSFSYISQLEEFMGEVNINSINKKINSPKEYKEYLSGGEKIRLKVKAALKEEVSLIIGDEPTSNLDRNSIKELEEIFSAYKGALILVSHDRDFLDKTCNLIIEINEGRIKTYKGNYSNYVLLKKEEIERENKEYKEYITEKSRLENAIIVKENQGNKIKSTPKRMGNSEARLFRKMGGQKGKKKIDKAVKNLENRINNLEVKEKPKDDKDIKIRIKSGLEIITKTPIVVKDLELKVSDKILAEKVSFRIIRGKKVALIGDNGTGKSTLIKELLKNEREEIKINSKVSFGYFDQELKILKEEETILDNIKDESSFDESFIRINLDGFGFRGDTVYKKVFTLSGGERVKVALCKIILSDNNILILDEPTNYLDINSMESLERALINTDKTLILVSHDKRFIENVCNYIIYLEEGKLKCFDGSYKELRNVKNTSKIDKEEKRIQEEKMLLDNKMSELISLISLEKNEERRTELNKEYIKLINRK
jgi:macrolide transport system ATP-binding/permease protein